MDAWRQRLDVSYSNLICYRKKLKMQQQQHKRKLTDSRLRSIKRTRTLTLSKMSLQEQEEQKNSCRKNKLLSDMIKYLLSTITRLQDLQNMRTELFKRSSVRSPMPRLNSLQLLQVDSKSAGGRTLTTCV